MQWSIAEATGMTSIINIIKKAVKVLGI